MLRQRFFTLRHYIYFQTVCLVAIAIYLGAGAYMDDAYISLRYARHLIEGYGLAWNPGEHVEGYTNFLFILLEAGLGRLGMNLVLASRVINFASYIGLLIVFAHYVGLIGKKRRGEDFSPLCSDIAFSLLATCVPVLMWCWEGLEPVFFTFILFCALYAVLEMIQRRSTAKLAITAGIFFGLVALTRLDGMLFLFASIGFLCAMRWVQRQASSVEWRHIILLAATAAAIIIPYMCWRYSYFGYWLPNTYYAKVYGIMKILLWTGGLFYLLLFIVMPQLLLLFATGMVSFVAIKKRFTPTLYYLVLLAVLSLAYIIDVGGDNMPFFRFFVPMIPILILIIYHCGFVFSALQPKLWSDICIGLLFFSVLQLGMIGEGKIAIGTTSGLAVAPYIDAHWPKGSLIAINAVGALPYVDDNYRYIDMLGLNDLHIAHRIITRIRTPAQHSIGHVKGDGAYVLERKPDYIIYSLSWGADTPDYLSDIELSESPDFKAHYQRMEVYIDAPPALLPLIEKLSRSKNPAAPHLDAQKRLRFIYFQRIPG